MLLTDLKTQTEKDSFINLAILVAKSDGSFGNAERDLIGMYEEEMGLSKNQVSLHPIDLNHLCNVFPDQRSKEIVYANLLSLAFVDGYDNEAKKCILDLIQENLTVRSSDAQQYANELKVVNGCYIPEYID